MSTHTKERNRITVKGGDPHCRETNFVFDDEHRRHNKVTVPFKTLGPWKIVGSNGHILYESKNKDSQMFTLDFTTHSHTLVSLTVSIDPDPGGGSPHR